jgi:hypothetical protein
MPAGGRARHRGHVPEPLPFDREPWPGPARRYVPWLLYLLTLLSAYPIGAILAAASPQPDGACSGIGFGCTLYGWDAAGFMLMIVGIPYALGLAFVLAVLGFLPWRWRPVQAVVATVGLAVPWAFAALAAASPR